jgi:hypothetical protein
MAALPQNVINELKAWLSDVSQTWMEVINGKHTNETGIDIGTHGKIDLPVYAVSSGKILGSGYYGGGGVVSEQSTIHYGGINGPASIYYQHLDKTLVSKGQDVVQGQLIGLSGGQLSGGSHPSSSQFSTGPHIEIGINAPYGKANQSIWSPLGPNVNPLGFFQGLLAGNNNSLLQNGTGAGPDPCTTDPNSIQCIMSRIQAAAAGASSAATSATDIPGALAALPGNITNSLGTAIHNAIAGQASNLGITSIGDVGWRALLIIIGFILMIAAIVFIGFDLLDKSNVEVAGSRV